MFVCLFVGVFYSIAAICLHVQKFREKAVKLHKYHKKEQIADWPGMSWYLHL